MPKYVTDAEWRYVARALGWSGYGIAAAWVYTEFEPDEVEDALDRYLPWRKPTRKTHDQPAPVL